MTVGALVPVLAAAALILSSGRPAAAAEAASLASAYNASAAEVLPQVFDDEGNALVSPVSLGTAMAMALAGARTDTEEGSEGAAAAN